MDQKVNSSSIYKPVLFEVSKYPKVTDVSQAVKLNADEIEVTDTTSIALKELFEVVHPETKDNFSQKLFDEFTKEHDIDQNLYGTWVYYPWKKHLVKAPPVEHLRLLRTARNQLLITPEEQKILFTKTILVAGMSVGSNVVEQLTHGGIGNRYILADMDHIEITNLNRIKTGLTSVGIHKVIDVARKAYELDPYLDIVVLDQGINSENLTKLTSDYQIDLFIDEVDDIEVKILLRKKAKASKKPVLMATDNSDGAVIDIERHDIDSEAKIFSGRIPSVILEKLQNGSISREEAGKAIGKYFVGFDLVDNRLIKSLGSVRKTIPSWPQLGTAASMSGILAAYCAKIILLGGELTSDRYIADYDKILNSNFSTDAYKTERDALMRMLNTDT